MPIALLAASTAPFTAPAAAPVAAPRTAAATAFLALLIMVGDERFLLGFFLLVLFLVAVLLVFFLPAVLIVLFLLAVRGEVDFVGVDFFLPLFAGIVFLLFDELL